MLSSADDLQHHRLGRRDDLSLDRHRPHERKARLFERISLPDLWTRRAFGAICITWRAEKSDSDVPCRHGAHLRAGVFHQLDHGGALPHALVGLLQLQIPAQRARLPDKYVFLRSRLGAFVPCRQPADHGVAVPRRPGVYDPGRVVHLRPVPDGHHPLRAQRHPAVEPPRQAPPAASGGQGSPVSGRRSAAAAV